MLVNNFEVKINGFFQKLPKVLTISLVLLLVSLQIFQILYSPIWTDDSCFAIVAKNLANSLGYSVVISDKIYPLYYGITTGPVIILPMSLMILIFGNQYWVLGLTFFLIFWSLLILIFLYLGRFISGNRRWVFCFFFLSLSFLFSINSENYGIYTENKLSLWYLLLGEVPAILFLILGSILLFLAKLNKKSIAISAIVLGCSIVCKTLILIAAAIVLLFFAINVLLEKKLENFKKLWLIFIASFCFLLPYLCFEFTKIIILGWQSYLESQIHNSKFYSDVALLSLDSANPAGKVRHLIRVFDIYIFLLPVLSIYLPYSAYKVRFKNHICYLIGTALIACFFLHMIWWIYFSVFRNDRYMIPALFYCFGGIAFLLTVLSYEKDFYFRKIWLVIFLLFISRAEAVDYIIKSGFKKNDRLFEQIKVTEKISDFKSDPKNREIEIISCGLNLEVEYLLPSIANFRNCFEWLDDKNRKQALLVNNFVEPNKVLMGGAFKSFIKMKPLPDKIKAKCRTEYFTTQNYSILRCE